MRGKVVGGGEVPNIQYCCQRPSSSSAKRKLLSDLAMHLKAKLEGGMLSVVGVYQPVLDQLADLDRRSPGGHKFVLVPVGWKTAIPLPRIFITLGDDLVAVLLSSILKLVYFDS